MRNEADIAKLIADGYEQISYARRVLARLPPGVERATDRREYRKQTAYMRNHAERDGHAVELTDAEYRLFKKLGGRVA